jgi:hypothetical protein
MPVIGRLDGQVDEVIIKPISERRRGEETPADADEATDAPQPPPAPQKPAPTQTPNEGESSPDTTELPVWLL